MVDIVVAAFGLTNVEYVQCSRLSDDLCFQYAHILCMDLEVLFLRTSNNKVVNPWRIVKNEIITVRLIIKKIKQLLPQ